MLRLFLWFALVYIVWKIMRAFSFRSQPPASDSRPHPPFSDIQEAEYEDLSGKPHEPKTPDPGEQR